MIVILFYMATHFTFSADYKQLRTPQRNTSVRHANEIMYNVFCKLFLARIDHSLQTICHRLFSDSSPACFSELFTVYILSTQLRSSADTHILPIPHITTKTFGESCFSYCAPKLWNSLPSHIRHIQSSHAFKTALKIHFYKKRESKVSCGRIGYKRL